MACRTLYRVVVLADEYFPLPRGTEAWASKTSRGSFVVRFEAGALRDESRVLHADDLKILPGTCVEFDTPGTHVELGYVFEQHKDLKQDAEA